MGKYMTVKETSDIWGISSARITMLCREGRIEYAKKEGRSWLIPSDAEKPADERIKSGSYIKHRVTSKEKMMAPLPFPIGISEYKLASTEYYYVDKTLLIKDFIDERPKVSLFTRPRRFGKTLNMDMLRTFFEKTDEDTSVYFMNKKIWSCGKKYQEYQGKYPVIFLSFKDVKFQTWEETFSALAKLIAMEFKRHSVLEESEKNTEKEYYNKVISESCDSSELSVSLKILSQMLAEHYGIAPVIIIDEYDTPIQQVHTRGFYDEVVLFMRNLFSGGLKDNKNLSFGFLTGILRVAKESIFSGLNNLTINSILDNKYSEYFGFTADEVRDMAKHYGVLDKYQEICDWYDGYKFGKSEIFNPWSVINYFRNDCQPRAYWLSTGSNDIIGEILKESDATVYEKLQKLLIGESILTYVDPSVIYPKVKSDPSSIYSFLLLAGYLNIVTAESVMGDDYMGYLALPNKEISLVYRKEILQNFKDLISPAFSIALQEALYSGDVALLKTQLCNLLLHSVSYHDTMGENFYHGLLLGLCAVVSDSYITSNRESGYGRYDIQLMPKSLNLPGILIELKSEKSCSENRLKELSLEALTQIKEKSYDAELISKGVNKIFKYGVAFSGKMVEISIEE